MSAQPVWIRLLMNEAAEREVVEQVHRGAEYITRRWHADLSQKSVYFVGLRGPTWLGSAPTAKLVHFA